MISQKVSKANILGPFLLLSLATESNKKQTFDKQFLKGRLIWRAKNVPNGLLYLLFDMSLPPAIKNWLKNENCT